MACYPLGGRREWEGNSQKVFVAFTKWGVLQMYHHHYHQTNLLWRESSVDGVDAVIERSRADDGWVLLLVSVAMLSSGLQ